MTKCAGLSIAKADTLVAMSEAQAMTRDWENRALSARQKAVARALAEAMFDDGTTDGMAERLAWTIDELDKLLGFAGYVTRFGLKVLLFVLQVLPVFMGFGFARMSGLKRKQRLAFLESVEQSRVPFVSTAYFAWKTALTVTYFEHPDALLETGYTGTCLLGEGSLTRGGRRHSGAASEQGAA
jgi:hypothetical protein